MTALHRLRQLHQQATQGDWSYDSYAAIYSSAMPYDEDDDDAPLPIIARVNTGYDGTDRIASQADAQLIAAARNALPHLLDIAEAADAVMLERRHTAEWHDRLDELREALDRLNSA